jgi:hypothetical protein
VIATSSLWLAKAWNRSTEKYTRERNGNLLRRQLRKLTVNFSQYLDGRSLEDLNPDELNALATVMPNFSSQYRLKMYGGMVKDALEQKSISLASSWREFDSLRKQLGINDQEHFTVLERLRSQHPQLFANTKLTVAGDEDLTVMRSRERLPKVSPQVQNRDDLTVVRPRKFFR